MHSTHKDMEELQTQLKKGAVQKAYRALLSYMMALRTHFVTKYGDPAISALYQGYLDMTYFALFPPSLKRHDLKVAIVFNYEAFQFEAWLAARNRKVQRQYWEIFKERALPQYRIVTPAGGIDSIIEFDLAKDFDLSDPDTLTSRIEKQINTFIEDIESVLAERQPQ